MGDLFRLFVEFPSRQRRTPLTGINRPFLYIVQSLTFGRLLQRKEGQPHPGPIFVLSSSFSVLARRDTGELHHPGGRLSGSILTEGRLEREFSISDLG